MRGGYSPIIFDSGGSKSVAPDDRWSSWTPTGFHTTNVTYTGLVRRVGNTAHYKVKVTFSGATDSGAFRLNLPSGHVADTTKMISTATSNYNLGNAVISDTGSGSYIGKVGYIDTTTVAVRFLKDFTTVQYLSGYTDTAPVTIASGDFVQLEFSLPIVGW